MNISIERIEAIRRELASLPPAPRIRTAVTKAEAIQAIAPELLELRKKGYGLEALVALLSAKGLVIALGTLKNYLRRCGTTERKRRKYISPSKAAIDQRDAGVRVARSEKLTECGDGSDDTLIT